MGFGNLGLDDELVQQAVFNKQYADPSDVNGSGEVGSGEVTVWDSDMDASDPGTTYSSWDAYDKAQTTNRQDRSTQGVTRRKRQLRKINGGRVLQYPVDIDINLQDYFEMQAFKYRPAGRLPDLNDSTEEQIDSDTIGSRLGYGRRYNRQNFRLQDLQSTIQIPIPNSLKDNNAVGWGPEEISGLLGTVGGPALENLFAQEGSNQGLIKDILRTGGSTAEKLKSLTSQDGPMQQFRRRSALNALSSAAGALGINIDVNQAITRINGTIINPNMELLFNGPSLRTFSFTIRFTPRNTEESARIRMIIRVLKQHSAVKRNPQNLASIGGEKADPAGSNFLLGTPDVWKLRYIKAKTQKDIKGLNKFKTCALKTVSVDYTGEAGRFAAYDVDSQPITTLMTLNFSELVPLYDQDYLEFDSDDDVGL